MANITLIGAGNQAHALLELFSKQGHQVSFLTRKAGLINQVMQAAGGDKNAIRIVRTVDGESREDHSFAEPVTVTDDPADLIPHADIIIITNPANDRQRVINQIKPYLPKDRLVLLGAIPAWGGFDWLTNSELDKHDNLIVWGLKDTPLMASHLKPGQEVRLLGMKEELFYAIAHPNERKKSLVRNTLVSLFRAKLTYCEHFIEFAVCAGNPVEHLPIVYGKIGPYSQWNGQPFKQQPLFYENISELEAYFVAVADEEQHAIIDAIRRQLGTAFENAIPLKDDIIKIYGKQVKNPSTLYTTIKSNCAYQSIKVPMKKVDGGFDFDLSHRIFSEDIPFGLDIFIELGRQLEVDTPFFHQLRDWLSAIGFSSDHSALDYMPDNIFGTEIRDTSSNVQEEPENA